MDAVAAYELTKILGGKTVLQGVSFQVPEGGSMACVGREGAGKTTLARLRNELYVFAELPVPETPVKKLLHTLSEPIKAVAEAMTETAGTMVEMADILAEPVKEMVEGDPDRDGNHSERGRKE